MDRNWKDVAGGTLLVFVGVYVAFSAFGFGLGSASRMGAGYYPLLLGISAVIIGVCIAIIGLRERADAPKLAPRTFFLVMAGLITFAMLVERAGLIPAIWGLVVLSALADREVTIREIIGLAVSASVAAWIVFVLLLRLPLSGIEGLF